MKNRSRSTWLSLFFFVWFVIGCASQEEIADNKLENTPHYKPTNVFSVPELPNDIKRVAILPLANDRYTKETRNIISNRLKTNISQTNRFESVPVSSQLISTQYSRPTFRSYHQIPSDFFDRLQSTFGADAVLFSGLTEYDPYQPIKLGLRMRLVSMKDGKTLWAFDDVFRAGDARVASGAIAFQQRQDSPSYPMSQKGYTILQSPSKFADYALKTALSTLPQRGTSLDTLSVTNGRAKNPTQRPDPKDQTSSDNPEIPRF